MMTRIFAEALSGLLRSVGLGVELFASAQEFLASAQASRIPCLVLDVRLPGRSGLDFYDDLVKANIACCPSSSSAATPIFRCRFGP